MTALIFSLTAGCSGKAADPCVAAKTSLESLTATLSQSLKTALATSLGGDPSGGLLAERSAIATFDNGLVQVQLPASVSNKVDAVIRADSRMLADINLAATSGRTLAWATEWAAATADEASAIEILDRALHPGC